MKTFNRYVIGSKQVGIIDEWSDTDELVLYSGDLESAVFNSRIDTPKHYETDTGDVTEMSMHVFYNQLQKGSWNHFMMFRAFMKEEENRGFESVLTYLAYHKIQIIKSIGGMLKKYVSKEKVTGKEAVRIEYFSRVLTQIKLYDSEELIHWLNDNEDYGCVNLNGERYTDVFNRFEMYSRPERLSHERIDEVIDELLDVSESLAYEADYHQLMDGLRQDILSRMVDEYAT